MPSFDLPKSIDDVQEPEPLEEDFYVCRVVEDPELKPSKKMQNNPDAEDARYNLVVKLRVQSDEPKENGRPLTLYLPWPNANDKTKLTALGQTFEDMFVARIADTAEALMGYKVEGTHVEVSAGQEAWFYVEKVERQDGAGFMNQLSMNMKPRKLEDAPPSSADEAAF